MVYGQRRTGSGGLGRHSQYGEPLSHGDLSFNEQPLRHGEPNQGRDLAALAGFLRRILRLAD